MNCSFINNNNNNNKVAFYFLILFGYSRILCYFCNGTFKDELVVISFKLGVPKGVSLLR